MCTSCGLVRKVSRSGGVFAFLALSSSSDNLLLALTSHCEWKTRKVRELVRLMEVLHTGKFKPHVSFHF